MLVRIFAQSRHCYPSHDHHYIVCSRSHSLPGRGGGCTQTDAVEIISRNPQVEGGIPRQREKQQSGLLYE